MAWGAPNAAYALPPLPPREEWGSKDRFRKFKQVTPTGRKTKRKRRCQSFSKGQLRKGFRAEEAQCPNSARPGFRTCKAHGGRSERPANVKEQLDIYAKHLRGDIIGLYLDSKADSTLLSLQKETALMQARAVTLMERLDTGESSKAWAEVKSAEIVLRQALKEQNVADLMNGLQTSHQMLRHALKRSDYVLWHELEDTLHGKARLAGAENRRLRELDLVMSIEDLLGVAAELQRGLMKAFESREERIMITDVFAKVLHRDLPGPLTPEEEGLSINTEWLVTGERGCYICRHEYYRQRNVDGNGYFQCPNCHTTWEPEYNGVEVVEGEVVKGALPQLEQPPKKIPDRIELPVEKQMGRMYTRNDYEGAPI